MQGDTEADEDNNNNNNTAAPGLAIRLAGQVRANDKVLYTYLANTIVNGKMGLVISTFSKSVKGRD